jgi:hypothetical protein
MRSFAEAIGAGRISKVEKIDDCCVLAAVRARAWAHHACVVMHFLHKPAQMHVEIYLPPWPQT